METSLWSFRKTFPQSFRSASSFGLRRRFLAGLGAPVVVEMNIYPPGRWERHVLFIEMSHLSWGGSCSGPLLCVSSGSVRCSTTEHNAAESTGSTSSLYSLLYLIIIHLDTWSTAALNVQGVEVGMVCIRRTRVRRGTCSHTRNNKQVRVPKSVFTALSVRLYPPPIHSVSTVMFVSPVFMSTAQAR